MYKKMLSPCKFVLFLCIALQQTGWGDDAVHEALYHLRDLTGYAHLLTFVSNMPTALESQLNMTISVQMSINQ